MVILASLGIASNKFREVLKLRMLGDSGDKADTKYINFAMRPDDGQCLPTTFIESFEFNFMVISSATPLDTL